MEPVDLKDLKERELVKGFHARLVHTPDLTLAYWTIDAGAAVPDHKHPHEQVVNMLEGTFTLTVEGKPHTLTPGMVMALPPDVPHSGRALTDCRILDVFHPAREDYR